MYRLFFIAFLIFCSEYEAIAQVLVKKDISLEDAMLKSSKYSPESLPGLKWYAGTDKILKNSKDRKSVLVSEVGSNQWDTLFNVRELNSACKINLKVVPGYSFISDSIILFQNENNYLKYNLFFKTGEIYTKEPIYGENHDFCLKTGNFAYTISNNLFIARSNGDSSVVTDFKDENIVAGQSIARNEFGIQKGTFWSPDGKILAFYQKNESDVTDYPLVDITTTPAALMSIKYPMAGMLSEIPSVGVYDLTGNSLIYLKTIEDDHYLTNLTWDPSGQFIYIAEINRDQNHFWFNKYDIKSGEKVKTLFEEHNDRYAEPTDEAWFIPGRINEFLWYSYRNGFKHLYRYNTDGKLLNQVTDGLFPVNVILGTDKSGKNIYVSAFDGSGLNDDLYLVSLDKLKMQKLNSELGVHSFVLSKSGKYLIDTYSNLTTPKKINIIDHKSNIVQNLLVSKNPVDSVKIGATEILSILGGDNKTLLNGRIIKPFDFDPAKKYKVFVYVYGGPKLQMVRNGWLAYSSLWMYALANNGYLVFVLDNRGSENRGFEFESIIHRNLGVNETEDQMQGVKYLKSLPYVDTTKMAIHGWSYGGFLTTNIMLKKPGVFKVGVAGGPVINWEWYEVMYGERYMDRPEENPEGYKKSNLLNYVDNLQGDMMFINGSVDPVVVPQHSMAVIKKLIEANKGVDYFTYPMHEHNVYGPDRYHLMKKIFDYVDEKLSKD